METLCDPPVLLAVATAVVGVVLFGTAARLPMLFPPWVARLVALFVVAAALFPIYVYTERLQEVYLVGGTSLAILLVIHLVQVSVRPSPPPLADPPPAATPDDPPDASS